MRVALLRLLSGANALTLRMASAPTSDREWILPHALPAAQQSIRVAGVSGNNLTWEFYTPASGSGSGTVNSVDMSVPNPEFTVSGTPITSSGTIALSWKAQNINLIFASPASGGAGIPSFRAMVSNDVPALDAAKITTGIFADARISTNIARTGDSRFHTQNTDTGTTSQTFHLNNDNTGVLLKSTDATGALEIRNNADSAFANLTVNNLTVQGTQTIINSNEVNIGDNILTLNADYTGSTPSENGGIEIERGTLTNSSFIWNESTDAWCAGIAGSELPLTRYFRRQFTSTDVVSNQLGVQHNLNNRFVMWMIYDNNGVAVFPGVVTVDANNMTFFFETITISGSWQAVVIG